MPLSQLAVRIDSRVRRTLSAVTRARGLKISHFVQEAILDKLEELEDSEGIRRLRRQISRPLKELLRDLDR